MVFSFTTTEGLLVAMVKRKWPPFKSFCTKLKTLGTPLVSLHFTSTEYYVNIMSGYKVCNGECGSYESLTGKRQGTLKAEGCTVS